MVIGTQVEAITLTPAAAGALRDLYTKSNREGQAVRVFVYSGGCGGYQYGMSSEGGSRSGDQRFESQRFPIVIDSNSLRYLRGSTIDFVSDPSGGDFAIDNPNVVSTCGCGKSFRTAEDLEASEGSSACTCGGECEGSCSCGCGA
ncbi:MAG: iron-sulfur cluster assembly accessory protein [Anaerolineales bacterium]|jgi:iron-sulfur cluster assembly protein